MARKITITIPLKGISEGKIKPRVQTSGYEGEACLQAGKVFEDALGSQTEEHKTEEYFQQEAGIETVTEGHGGEEQP